MAATLSPRCLSSHLTTWVSEFRNPQGRDENWLFREEVPQIQSYITYSSRVITAEVAYSILAVTSSVEAVAYNILGLLLFPLSIVTEKPLVYFLELSDSANFTTKWNIGNAVYLNFFHRNLNTLEFLARTYQFNETNVHYHLDETNKLNKVIKLFLCSMPFLSYYVFLMGGGFFPSILINNVFSTILGGYVYGGSNHIRSLNWLSTRDWYNTHFPGRDWYDIHYDIHLERNPARHGVYQQIPNPQQTVLEGAEFIGANIFPCIIDQLSKDAIIELDSASFHYLSTLSVYSFTFGSKSADAIPEFFKEETRVAISNLRDGELAHGLINELSAYMHSEENIFMAINKFEEGCPENEMGRLYGRLRQAAHNEVERPGIFIGACLQRAIAQH